MAVPIPGSINSSIKSEYAATSINLNRQMIKNENGFLISAFTASLTYEKKTYVLDSNGNKIGLVIGDPQQTLYQMNDADRGNISLNMVEFSQYFSKVCIGGEVLGEEVATLADNLIALDLIKRGILSA